MPLMTGFLFARRCAKGKKRRRLRSFEVKGKTKVPFLQNSIYIKTLVCLFFILNGHSREPES